MTTEIEVTSAKATPGGTIIHEGKSYAFDLIGAKPLSLEIRFSNGEIPEDRIDVDEVTIDVGAEQLELGRCRFEAWGDATDGVLIPVEHPIKAQELYLRKKLVRLDQGFDQLPLLLTRKDAIKPEFRAYTADLAYELAIYRQLFDEVDASLEGERPETQARVRASVLATRGRAFLQFFDKRLRTLEELVFGFTRQEHERHGFYFRRIVWQHIAPSAFLWRTNIRPRGYAGDSMMMQYLYENGYLGDSLFGQLMHKHPIESAAAQAVRNRRKLIVDEVSAAYAERRDPSRKLKILSVACGPAWEVRDLFATQEECGRYACTLLDQDEEALGEAEAAIKAVSERQGAPIEARFLRESVRTMLMTKNLTGLFGQHDFIYSMGLFDYLTAPVARTVLKKLYELLEPGGRLIIGNFHVGNPTRLYMEYWMDWVLLYRSEADFEALAAELPGASSRIFLEETKSQMFIEIRKP